MTISIMDLHARWRPAVCHAGLSLVSWNGPSTAFAIDLGKVYAVASQTGIAVLSGLGFRLARRSQGVAA